MFGAVTNIYTSGKNTLGAICNIIDTDSFNRVCISTYNLSYKGMVERVIDKLGVCSNHGCDVSIIIGLNFRPYHDAGETRTRILDSYLTLQRKYPRIKFYVTHRHHSKYTIFSNGKFLIGSMNYTDSNWEDMCVLIRLDDNETEYILRTHESVENSVIVYSLHDMEDYILKEMSRYKEHNELFL